MRGRADRAAGHVSRRVIPHRVDAARAASRNRRRQATHTLCLPTPKATTSARCGHPTIQYEYVVSSLKASEAHCEAPREHSGRAGGRARAHRVAGCGAGRGSLAGPDGSRAHVSSRWGCTKGSWRAPRSRSRASRCCRRSRLRLRVRTDTRPRWFCGLHAPGLSLRARGCRLLSVLMHAVRPV